MWVTDSRMLRSRPKSCLVHPVDRFDSEEWFSSDQVIFWTVFHVFWWKSMQHLSEKNAISGFPISPGSAKALVRWGGKIKYTSIAYFLSNIYAKNCRSRKQYVKIIASQRWDFFETQCTEVVCVIAWYMAVEHGQWRMGTSWHQWVEMRMIRRMCGIK